MFYLVVNMAYDIDFSKKGDFKLHVRRFFLKPSFWVDPDNIFIHKLKWKRIKFNKQNLTYLPTNKGIYCFVVIPKFKNFFETKYLFYVGKTKRTLKERFKEYLRDQRGKGKPRPKIFEMLNLYNDSLYFFYTEVNNNSTIDEIEEKLLNTFFPHINTDIPIVKIKPELNKIYE